MPWHPDIPDFPVEKPRELEKLEGLAPAIMNAMTGLEIDEHIDDAALSLAKSYLHNGQNQIDYGYEGCTLLVSEALSQTGASLDSKLGTRMIAKSVEAAKQACRQFFPEIY